MAAVQEPPQLFNDVGSHGESRYPTPDPVADNKPLSPTEEPIGSAVMEESLPTETESEAAEEEEPSKEVDTAKSLDNAEQVKVGKKVSRAVNAIEGEIEEILEEYSKEIPESLKKQIELLRKLSEELRDADSKPSTDEPQEWQTEPKRVTQEEWKNDLLDKDAPKSALKAFYRSLPSGRDNSVHLNRKELPYRVAVNSTILDYELEQIAQVSNEYFPMVVVAPFKIFVRYYPQIDARLEELKKLHAISAEEEEKMAQASDSSQEVPAAEGTQESEAASEDVPDELSDTASESPRSKLKPAKTEEELKDRTKELAVSVSHMQQLRDFIRDDLSYYLRLCEKIKDGTLEKIAFEDLWYLFEQGELIYGKESDHDQLYKAYAVGGGLQRQARTGEQTRKNDEELLRLFQKYQSRGEDTGDELELDTRVEASGVGSFNPLMVDCFVMGFDGLRVGPIDCCKMIKPYGGERRIIDLPVLPLRFHPQKDEILARAIARGRKYMSCSGHKNYNDLTAPVTRRDHQIDVRGDIFIDFREFYSVNPRQKPRLGRLRKSKADITEVTEIMTSRRFLDHEVDESIMDNYMAKNRALLEPVDPSVARDSIEYLQLFPYYVPAYAFRTRAYIYVNIDSVMEIDKSDAARDNGFEDLVIPKSHRDLLIPLVMKHATGAGADPDSQQVGSTQIDIVRGKGRGLIILLHGPPGSGKTSTAETIAAYTRRPLYSITCGDLGTSPTGVERKLKEHTDRAYRWGCVLLLDEADVFLTRRDWRDMERNALVSTFLRQLEYYSGILFLTTNRVGVVDEAFKSRIHISLRYPRVQLLETLRIWENTLNRIESDNKKAKIQVRFDREALTNFAEKHYRLHERSETTWNGRQIRNAFQTALALGYHDRERELRKAGLTEEEAAASGERKWMRVKLTTKNFQSIAKTAREFEDYLVSVRGQDSDLARESQLRDDSHDVDSPWLQKEYGRTRDGRGGGRGAGLLTTPTQRRGVSDRSGGSANGRASRRPRSEEEDNLGDEDDILDEDLSDDD